MNYCRKCQSDYEKPGTCNCFAPITPRQDVAPLPYVPYVPYVPNYPPLPWWYWGPTFSGTALPVPQVITVGDPIGTTSTGNICGNNTSFTVGGTC